MDKTGTMKMARTLGTIEVGKHWLWHLDYGQGVTDTGVIAMELLLIRLINIRGNIIKGIRTGDLGGNDE